MFAPRIDVHAHFLPDFYRDSLVAAGKVHPDGMPAIPEWNEELALRTMADLNIVKAMLSISSPGVYFGDKDAARSLARRVNEEAARLRDRHPDRFGWFATTPLPDVAQALQESQHALDVLHADGIVVETNHDGMYLGDDRLEPLYEELNRRGAVVFIRPTSTSCVGCGALALGYPEPMLEFMFETTRSVTQLILAGVTVRYPDIRFIVPHGGAALCVLASRIDLLMPFFEKGSSRKPPHMASELLKLYYDLAGAPLPELLQGLMLIADEHRILYGSDWPFTQTEACVELARKLEFTPLLSEETRDKFCMRNAQALFHSEHDIGTSHGHE